MALPLNLPSSDKECFLKTALPHPFLFITMFMPAHGTTDHPYEYYRLDLVIV